MEDIKSKPSLYPLDKFPELERLKVLKHELERIIKIKIGSS